MTEQALDGLYIRPIAHIHTDYAQKFGIPRQSGLVSEAEGIIEFGPEFAKNKAVLGLAEFSHLWLIWYFENGCEGGSAADIATDTQAEAHVAAESEESFKETAAAKVHESLTRKWSTTVRPPRLGGDVRKGVFATRSPFRPNPLGLSCVRLDRVELTQKGPLLYVRGADLRNGTPIFDIKPYLPLADCQPEASGGFTDHIAPGLLQVEIPSDLLALIPKEKRAAITQILENDPRPVGTTDPDHVYTLAYAGLEIAFVVAEDTAAITSVSAI